MREPAEKPDGEFVCICECGGNVLGVRDFGRLWTWCDKCTPVVTVDVHCLDPKEPTPGA